MVIDCHVHVSAVTPGRGIMSPTLLRKIPFRFMRWKFGLEGKSSEDDLRIEKLLAQTLLDTAELDAAVILAFDGVYDVEGNFDDRNTHLYVSNDYAMELTARNQKMLFGASVNPYRKDAVKEMERCIQAGAVLMKWLPMVQGFDPSDERCFPVYEVLKHYGLPLLSHTGAENALPVYDVALADPKLLEPALKRGVTVIAAHCGTRFWPTDVDYCPTFIRMTQQYENLYGDTAALNLPRRWNSFKLLFDDPVARGRLVHGSDWPIIPISPFKQLGVGRSVRLMREKNWMKRDILIKREVGFDEAYWNRAAKILRLPKGRQAV